MDLDELARKHGVIYDVAGFVYHEVSPDRLRALVNEVLEEAARECAARHANGNHKYDTRHECADAIRALKLK